MKTGSMLSGWLALAMWAGSPVFSAPINFGGGVEVALGEELPFVAARLDEKAFPVDGGRPGKDLMLATPEAQFYFDSGRLWRMTLKPSYRMFHPPRPFAEDWKNFGGIGDLRLDPKMGREEFLAYLAAWKARAERAGKREGTDFRVDTRSEELPAGAVAITMGPWRRLMGTGRMTGDRWLVTFEAKFDVRTNSFTKEKSLHEITFEADEFSTLRRETKADRDYVPVKPVHGRPLAAAGEPGPEIGLADGNTVRFGADIGEIEAKFAVKSVENPLPSARAGMDRWIVTPTALLEFDAGRLRAVGFNAGDMPARPIRCFAEDWQNPDPIDELRIELGQTREDLRAYLAAWRKRAMLARKREGADYWIVEPKENTGTAEVSVTFAPRRVSPTGTEFFGDGWTATFGKNDAGPFNRLNLFSVTLDAFATAGRPGPGERDPATAGVVLEDGTRLFFGQERREVERLLGGAALVKSVAAPLMPFGDVRSSIAVRPVSLLFDGGKLQSIQQRGSFESPASFAEAWKNLTPIGDARFESGMTRERWADYLRAWKQRVAELGTGYDRAFRIEEKKTDVAETHVISMRPSRRSAGGGDWPDLWVVSLMAVGPATDRRWEVAVSTAFCGEYDSRPAPKPAPARSKEKEQGVGRPQIVPTPLQFPSIGPDLPPL